MNKITKITINDKEYNVKYTLRALFIFEQITHKPFEIKTMLDNYVFFYSMILASNDDVLSWDEFIDALDNDPTIYLSLNKVINDATKLDNLIADGDENNKKGSKKNSQSRKSTQS